MKAQKTKVENTMKKRIIKKSIATSSLLVMALFTTAMIVDSSTILSSINVKIAEVQADLYKYEKGLPWADEAVRMNPTSPEAHLISGYLNFKHRHTGEAITALERTIELEPSNFEAYDYLGIEYFNQGMEVADTLEELSTAYADRGLAYGLMRRYDESSADFDTALSINPDNGWAVFCQGKVTEAKAEREKAAQDQGELPATDVVMMLGN